MLQECLNATIVLHVHKESTDALNLQRLSNEFVFKSNYCKSKIPVYGLYSACHIVIVVV